METNRMKKLLLTLPAMVFTLASVSPAAFAGVNIPIGLPQVALSIAQAIRSTQEPTYKSKPVKTPGSKKKQTASRSSSTPSPEPTPSAARLAEELVPSEGAEASEKQPEAQQIDFETLRAKADSGDANSQYHLGLRYQTGNGVGNDFAEAVKWFRKAAEQNYAPALNDLGLAYIKGNGVAEDHVEAVKWFRKAAEQGRRGSQYNLGLCYANGEGVGRDLVEAVKWFRKAAEQNYAPAQNSLALSYRDGKDVGKNLEQAVSWFHKAAGQNYARAQVNLAFCFRNGTGVRKDYAEAVKWLNKAADQNDARAEDLLGELYQDGQGVPKNYQQAVNWYRKAADQNDPVAQLHLASCYYYGKGVPKNYIECYKWVLLSAAQGNQVARKNTSIVEKKMSPNQIAEGQRLARDFKPGEVPAAEAEVSEASPRASGTGSFITAASAATPQETTTDADEWRVIKPGQLVAVDEKTLDLALGMMTSEDAEGLMTLMEEGKAILSKGGHKVQLVNVHLHVLDVTKMEIRFKGDTHVYWCYVDALEGKG